MGFVSIRWWSGLVGGLRSEFFFFLLFRFLGEERRGEGRGRGGEAKGEGSERRRRWEMGNGK